MTFRERYNRQISFYFLLALGLHVPVFVYMAFTNDKSVFSALGLSALLLSAPALMYLTGIKSSLLPRTLAFTTIGFSALLIHFGNGMIEMHFHIFISLACFIAFGLVSPLLIGVVTTAVHHIAFFFLLPASVFNYQASFSIVLLHAGFVALEAIPVFLIASRFQKLIDLQDSTFGEIEKISLKLANTSQAMSSSGQELSETANTTAASLEETSASLEQLSSSVKMNADHAGVAARLSQDSKERASAGDQEVRQLIVSMEKISAASRKIEEITNVIDDIAFQTNLLALNAAVEAARAGDQGKGFAVVAEAVRSLAQRSAVAATDISKLIKENVEIIDEGVLAADRSGEVLKSIVESVHKVTDLVKEISVASTEQSQGVAQISQAVSQMDTSAQKNAESSQVIVASVAEIENYSENLRHLWDEFNQELGFQKKAS